MEYLDWIALITGVLGVILTIFETIWCWPIALISVGISVVTFYNQRLYGDMSLNIFYVLSGFYGWFYWNKNKHQEFKVTNMPTKWIVYGFLITVIQTVIYYYLLRHFKSDQVLFDSILTACSFTCTYMMARKWLQNWLIWVFIDAAYVILYVIKDMNTYALLYGFFTLMAAYGFYKWKNQLKVL